MALASQAAAGSGAGLRFCKPWRAGLGVRRRPGAWPWACPTCKL